MPIVVGVNVKEIVPDDASYPDTVPFDTGALD
jgi:hypothetical protein